MLSNSNSKMVNVAIRDGVNGIRQHILLRQKVFYLLSGLSLGIGFGVIFNVIWNYIAKLHRQSSNNNDLRKLKDEITDLRNELLDMLSELRTNNRSNKIQFPRFSPSDTPNSDEFFDPENDDAILNTNQFAINAVSSSTQLMDAQKQLFKLPSSEILTEIDHAAHLAMGDLITGEGIPKIEPSGDQPSFRLQAYAKCLIYKHKYRRNPYFLWRFARAVYLAYNHIDLDGANTSISMDADECASDVTSTSAYSCDPANPNDQSYKFQSRCEFVETGLRAARRALREASMNNGSFNVDPITLSEIYKWLAVMIGLITEYTGVRQRIKYGYEFKEMVDKSIELNPCDAFAHYLRGRWCFEVHNLSWIERRLAASLFTEPPTSTVEEAETAFNEAESVCPNHFAAVYFYRAKCCLCRCDYKGAVENLRCAQRLFEKDRYPVPHLDTAVIHEEVKLLYRKYSTYA